MGDGGILIYYMYMMRGEGLSVKRVLLNILAHAGDVITHYGGGNLTREGCIVGSQCLFFDMTRNLTEIGTRFKE